MKICLLLSVFAFACAYGVDPIPKIVPFGGIALSSLPSVSFGQVVTGISDITSFSLSIAATSGPGGNTATAYFAKWASGAPQTPLLTVPGITLPTNGVGYATITVNMGLVNLDPIAPYVIYFTVSSTSKYEVFSQFTPDGSVGGLVKAVGNTWRSGFTEDAVFSLAFDSLLRINPDFNFAQSHEPSGWTCLVNTTFHCLQVNWQTLYANTLFVPCAVNNKVRYGSSSCLTSTYATYGTASACWDLQYQQAWSYGYCDLRGTQYKFGGSWIAGAGFLASGWANFDNNNQTVDIAGSGDCGSTFVAGAPNEITPGFYLKLARV